MKNLFVLMALFIMGAVSAALTTTDCTWVGWDSIQACGRFTFNTSYTNITVITNYTNITQISNITPGHTNTIEVLGVLALLIIILFVAAQLGDMRILGVFASLLLLLLGVLIITDGVVYKVGDITAGVDTDLRLGTYQNVSGNVTFNETITTHLNQTSTSAYAPMTVPYVDFDEMLGLVLVLLSLFGMLYYGLGVGRYLNQGK